MRVRLQQSLLCRALIWCIWRTDLAKPFATIATQTVLLAALRAPPSWRWNEARCIVELLRDTLSLRKAAVGERAKLAEYFEAHSTTANLRASTDLVFAQPSLHDARIPPSRA